MIKEFKFEVKGKAIHLDEGGCTLPECTRIIFDLVLNLTKIHTKPTAKLEFDETGMVVTLHDPATGSFSKKLSGKDDPAVIMFKVENGFPIDANIQTNGQSMEAVIKASEYLQARYSKRLCNIAQALFGDNEAGQEEWIERVVNYNKI